MSIQQKLTASVLKILKQCCETYKSNSKLQILPDSRQLLDFLLVVPSCNVTTAVSLELDDDLSEFDITLFFQVSEHTSAEKDLGLTDTEQVGVHIQIVDL